MGTYSKQDAEDIQDIEAHLCGGIPKRDIEALGNYWTVYPSMKQHLYTPIQKRPDYYQLNIANEDIKNSIYNHPEFTAFGAQMEAIFQPARAGVVAVMAAVLQHVQRATITTRF